MNTSLLLRGLFFALGSAAFAAQVGDTYDQVLAEKGKPAGKMQAGPTLVLRYPDLVIKLKEGRVTAVDIPPPETNVVRTVAPSQPAKAKSVAHPAAPAAAQLAWGTNYETALAQAKEKNRKVFMFFTGSDWCGWCHRLQDEILKQPGFANYARDNLVLLELDFPRNTPLSDELKAQNQKLAKRYRIEGYPTVVVLASDGRSVGRLGYMEGGPGPFVDILKGL
jgi:protein disulfide-isomerase